MAYQDEEENGLRMYSCLPGYGSSSTRAEIGAGILAIAAEGATHIGSDSQAFVSRATAIAKMVKNGKEPRRPWSTQKNGDLWQVFHNTLKMKGPDSFKATKVKGHATQEMVEGGKVRPQD